MIKYIGWIILLGSVAIACYVDTVLKIEIHNAYWYLWGSVFSSLGNALIYTADNIKERPEGPIDEVIQTTLEWWEDEE